MGGPIGRAVCRCTSAPSTIRGSIWRRRAVLRPERARPIRRGAARERIRSGIAVEPLWAGDAARAPISIGGVGLWCRAPVAWLVCRGEACGGSRGMDERSAKFRALGSEVYVEEE